MRKVSDYVILTVISILISISIVIEALDILSYLEWSLALILSPIWVPFVVLFAFVFAMAVTSLILFYIGQKHPGGKKTIKTTSLDASED